MPLMSIWSEINRFQSKINGGNIGKNKVKKSLCTAGFLKSLIMLIDIGSCTTKWVEFFQILAWESCLTQCGKGLRVVWGEQSRGFF